MLLGIDIIASEVTISIYQITSVLSKLPLTSVKWRIKQGSGKYGEYIQGGTSTNIKERRWIEVTTSVEEECVIQVELTRMCLAVGKVHISLHCD